MTQEAIFDGLNEAQRRAVGQVRGPLCILAGAGSGKTTTITRRIANQVLAGAFRPEEVLAVTFTDKAAGEMRARLEHLGVTGVRARTFHSAALAQLRNLAAEPVGDVLPGKGLALRQIANRLPKPYRFRPASDLATEVEWAKNRRIPPDRYVHSLGSHEPPIPADLMHRVYRTYEDGKRERDLVDFEDLLELTIRMFDTDEFARERFHNRYLAFTVDEFQDVNLLQHTLLERWLGGRDDLCAVGDDYQSIYGFNGASARWLLELPGRFVSTTVVKLEENYRSTPEILEIANRLAPRLGGASKTLRATKPSGPRPQFDVYTSRTAEVREIVEQIRALKAKGVPHEEIAILYRTNYGSEEFEEALASAAIPFQVRGAAFLARPAARRLLTSLANRRESGVAEQVRRAARRDGWIDDPPEDLGEQELTRQKDFARLVAMADEFGEGEGTAAEFVADVRARFGPEGDGRGVNLLTYHRAKGLEFDAVFLPRLNDGELPFKRALGEESLAEESRLLYVGITRARTYLFGSWVLDAKLRPSEFLTDLGINARPARSGRASAAEPSADRTLSPASEALRRWRLERARADGVPPYVILHDSTLEDIAARHPVSRAQLSGIVGIGPAKLDRYGAEILAVLGSTDSVVSN